MKKVLLILLAITLSFFFVACSSSVDGDLTSGGNQTSTGGEEPGIENQVTITFKQIGQDDIVKFVETGASLTDIPEPQSKAGYTVSWDKTDFTNLYEHIIVTAVEIPKTYTVVLNPNGGSVSGTTITVTYGQAYELPFPIHPEYAFSAWVWVNQKISLNGTWNIDSEDGVVELLAQWGKNAWSDFI